MTATQTPEAQIVIDRIGTERLIVPIVGTAPLICHRFSEKARRQMLDSMQGRKTLKQKRDPEADYEAAFYRLEGGGYGFPALAFKDATIGAARYYGKQVTMTSLKQFVFVHGERGDDGRALVRIDGEPRMREDVVRINNGGSTDLRYRPEFWPWRAELAVTYVTGSLTRSSLLSLIEAGGLGVGVGEWRPLGKKSSGDFGTYRIDTDRELEVIE